MSKQDEMKKITAQKKELNAKQKELREELNANKAERLAKTQAKADARKASKIAKAELRTLTSAIYAGFSGGDADTIAELADAITEVGTKLGSIVRDFSEACKEDEAPAVV